MRESKIENCDRNIHIESNSISLCMKKMIRIKLSYIIKIGIYNIINEGRTKKKKNLKRKKNWKSWPSFWSWGPSYFAIVFSIYWWASTQVLRTYKKLQYFINAVDTTDKYGYIFHVTRQVACGIQNNNM